MAFGQIIGGDPVEITASNPAQLADDGVASLATVTLWDDAERTAADILTIVEPTIPDGEVLTNPYLEIVGDEIHRNGDIGPPEVPRIIDRLRWLKAVKQKGDELEVDAMAIIFGAVDALGPNDPAYLYFHNAPYLDRDAPEYDTIETLLGSDEAGTTSVFALANSYPLPAGL